jgi:membrane-associated phospholipid phosphatase
MNKKALVCVFFLCVSRLLFSQEIVPFSKLFYNFGWNTLHSFTFNYGQNFLIAGLGTYAMVDTGIDWKWNRMAYDHPAVAYAGMPAGLIGAVLPIGLPLGLYLYGRNKGDGELQIAGLAMGQAAILGLGISSAIKAFTGRRPPGILDQDPDLNDYSGDWAFGFMNRGVFNGWPSGHTAVAFAMAAALAELYPDSIGLKIGAYSYAAFIGAGMSLMAHWASDSVAGALIGYAIGKSVGASFRQLSGSGSSRTTAKPGELSLGEKLSFYYNTVELGLVLRM